MADPTQLAAPIARGTSPIVDAEQTRTRRRGGRPSRADALRLRERILESATELFLTAGYGSTSIEAIASRTGISKRTFYHRFRDKTELFAAVVHRIIDQLRPPPSVPLVEGVDLHQVLTRLAMLILKAALSPAAIALHRLVTAESARFPELVRTVSAESTTQEAKALIADLISRQIKNPNLDAERRAFAAEQFLVMVISQPQRRAMGVGTGMTAAELLIWAERVVTLFLNGCHGWPPAMHHGSKR